MTRYRADLTATKRKQRDKLLKQQQADRERAEAVAVERGITETLALESRRGAEFELPDPKDRQRSATRIIRRMTGLEWLYSKGRITDDQLRVGNVYGALWRVSQGVISIRSHLDVGVGGQADRTATVRLRLSEAEARVQVSQRLDAMRARLLYQADLISALDVIAGREQTPREATANGAQAGALEVLVKVALDLLTRDLGRGRMPEAA